MDYIKKQVKSRLAGWTIYEVVRLRYHIYRLRHRIQNAAPLKVVLGAAETRFPGWISTDQHLLDITKAADWKRLFAPDSIDRLLMEHVLEHLDETACRLALRLCYRYLKPSGRLRIAVPDGYREDAYYLQHVSPPADGHQQLFTIDSLTSLLMEVGFSVQALEYYDAAHQFHAHPWDGADGYIKRSARFDRRPEFQRDDHFYTSLIVDAIK